jgi:hypothetical protein
MENQLEEVAKAIQQSMNWIMGVRDVVDGEPSLEDLLTTQKILSLITSKLETCHQRIDNYIDSYKDVVPEMDQEDEEPGEHEYVVMTSAGLNARLMEIKKEEMEIQERMRKLGPMVPRGYNLGKVAEPRVKTELKDKGYV